MAIIDLHTNHISGKVGNNVFYLRNGKQLMRRKPAPRKTGAVNTGVETPLQICLYYQISVAFKFPFL